MIYTRFGARIEVIANCGTHQPKGFKAPLTLLKIQYHDTTTGKNFYFAEFMKATEGWIEIQQAVADAPNLSLVGNELKEAIELAM